MRKPTLGAVALLLSAVLIGCERHEPMPEEAAPSPASNEEAALVGADEDEHGCKASAGFIWCARTEQCERPWQLGLRHQLEERPDAVAQFCAAPADAIE
ncbi:hypothetical protein [Ferrimonas pelagia]|uniref:Peptidase n=1 Tax=Ferrimonas pelagia TaxID=1177826 RepID=A0ABP9FHI0_9GAMM